MIREKSLRATVDGDQILNFFRGEIIEVIKVVIKNFLTFLGFFGAPGSFPLRSSLNSMFCDFMPKGKTEKKIIHQIQI